MKINTQCFFVNLRYAKPENLTHFNIFPAHIENYEIQSSQYILCFITYELDFKELKYVNHQKNDHEQRIDQVVIR